MSELREVNQGQISGHVPDDILSYLLQFLPTDLLLRLAMTSSFAYNKFMLEHLKSLEINVQSLAFFATRASQLTRLEELDFNLPPQDDSAINATKLMQHVGARLKRFHFSRLVSDRHGYLSLLNPKIIESLVITSLEDEGKILAFLDQETPKLRHLAIGGDCTPILQSLCEAEKKLHSIDLCIDVSDESEYLDNIKALIALAHRTKTLRHVVLWQEGNYIEFDDGSIQFLRCFDRKLTFYELGEIPAKFQESFGVPIHGVVCHTGLGARLSMFEIFWEHRLGPIEASVSSFSSFFEACHANHSPRRRAEALINALKGSIMTKDATTGAFQHHGESILAWVHSQLVDKSPPDVIDVKIAAEMVQQLDNTTLDDLKTFWNGKFRECLPDEASLSAYLRSPNCRLIQHAAQQPSWVLGVLNDIEWCASTSLVKNLCETIHRPALEVLQTLYNHPSFDPTFKVRGNNGLLHWVYSLASGEFLKREGLEFAIELMNRCQELGFADGGVGLIPSSSAFCFDDAELGFRALELFSQIFNQLVPIQEWGSLVWKAKQSFEPLIQLLEQYIALVRPFSA
eukprot:TRINITY_DN10653_c0_g1_i1.p1 TRINITY_DN10653_c0_g1~~TRINITY_DN10653_c0_g1_i1.p1  ORF type:complete len:570 (+),score=78.22 TRINITY_DN10653_c0_g1_i1:144-1853(+)